MASKREQPRRTIERIQTGVRLEKRLLLVLKALAGSLDLTLGDLLEGIVLHALEGKAPFRPETRATIEALRAVYKLDLGAADSHLLVERSAARPRRARSIGSTGSTGRARRAPR